MFLDFKAIKDQHPIDQVMDNLGLEMKQSGKSFRGKCPVCEGAKDRSLVITPEKGVYYCFSDGEGGDVIALVAHIRRCSAKEAAAWIVGDKATPEPKPTEPKAKERGGFKPLEYLEHDHPAVDAVGFEPEDAERLGIGFAPRGVMRGHVCVPVRLPDGTLCGYIGITEAKLPSGWRY